MTEELLFDVKKDKREEVNFKKNFCLKYFDKGTWDLDTLKKVDVDLHDRRGRHLLYIESKYRITNSSQLRKAIAQAVLTNKKQEFILSRVAVIYKDKHNDDVLDLIDCSDDSVMFNTDINWEKEVPNKPSKDAVDRINDRVYGKIKRFVNDDIKEFYERLKENKETTINITEDNISVVYNQWKSNIRFSGKIDDEQDLINLFLVDLLNGEKLKRAETKEIIDKTFFDEIVIGEVEVETEQNLIREGTNLGQYKLIKTDDTIGFVYSRLNKTSGVTTPIFYNVENVEQYKFFWKIYKRPPQRNEYLRILEHSSKLYTDKYRTDTGGEYTPSCFVEVQNEILRSHYNLDDYIVCDPCAGVGNLENQFGKDYKQYCYLSTLDQKDVDICKMKGFENAVQFDYLKDDSQPKWKYKGEMKSLAEILRLENRKLMIVMNPPYKLKAGFNYDLAIEFFLKVLKLKPDVIVYYCKTEFFLRDTVSVFKDSNYRIVSHIFSNAKDTFLLSEWSVSQVIFDKEKGEIIDGRYIKADRYDYIPKTEKLEYVKNYTYENECVRPNLIKEIEREIVSRQSQGLVLGQWSYLGNVLIVSNGGKEKPSKITSENLKYCLLSKGLNFNSHAKYYEWNYLVYRGYIDDINQELYNDSIMFSLFYKNNQFSNKGFKNYIMPFTAEELGCGINDLNVLFQEQGDFFEDNGVIQSFDFRDFMKQFEFSKEARHLYDCALEIFKYYHNNPEYMNKNYNDSFYDITNAIMDKDLSTFKQIEKKNDKRLVKTKTTKGTQGFSRVNIKNKVDKKYLPLFIRFFDARDALAEKINNQLCESHLVLWKRDNIK